jgi:hypothetical protein
MSDKNLLSFHIIDHELVSCLSSAAYQFVALLDEVLWHTRVDPVTADSVYTEAHGCWEALGDLKHRLALRDRDQ